MVLSTQGDNLFTYSVFQSLAVLLCFYNTEICECVSRVQWFILTKQKEIKYHPNYPFVEGKTLIISTCSHSGLLYLHENKWNIVLNVSMCKADKGVCTSSHI